MSGQTSDPSISCAKARRLIDEAFDLFHGRDLAPHEEATLQAHCGTCASCSAAFRVASDAAMAEAGTVLYGYSGATLDEQYEEYVRRSLF